MSRRTRPTIALAGQSQQQRLVGILGVVSVDVASDLLTHSKEAGGIPHRRAVLHQLRRGRVATRVRRDVAILRRKLRETNSSSERGLDRRHRLAVPFDEVLLGNARRSHK